MQNEEKEIPKELIDFANHFNQIWEKTPQEDRSNKDRYTSVLNLNIVKIYDSNQQIQMKYGSRSSFKSAVRNFLKNGTVTGKAATRANVSDQPIVQAPGHTLTAHDSDEKRIPYWLREKD